MGKWIIVIGEYNALENLADNCLKFMNPQGNWYHPRANCYQLYSIKGSYKYTCSAPFWEEAREEVFEWFRLQVNKPTISFLTLVHHTSESFSLPIGKQCPSNYGFFFLKGEGSHIIQSSAKDLERGLQCLCTTNPELVNWQDRNQYWFKMHDKMFHLVGNLYLSTILPKEGTLFFHVEFYDD
mgnify:CR=1 FL=1